MTIGLVFITLMTSCKLPTSSATARRTRESQSNGAVHTKHAIASNYLKLRCVFLDIWKQRSSSLVMAEQFVVVAITKKKKNSLNISL
jgi:hypothetical protein